MHSKFAEANAAELTKLDAAIKDAQDNFGETEVRETNLAKAEFLCRIGDKVGSLFAQRLSHLCSVKHGQCSHACAWCDQ